MTRVDPIETETAEPAPRKAIRFPARSFLAFALVPEAPLDEWFQGLDRWTENSPGFFSGRPVVLDLNLLRPEVDDVAPLVAELAERGIRIYAIEANGMDNLGPDLPPILKGARPAMIDAPEPAPEAEEAAEAQEAQAMPPASTTLVIDSPIRSGQTVYHPQGDVIVLGSAASGSEILAGGSIHVYGTLRGRAHAGVTGNSRARIFCRRNEAEMLAVDGWYQTAEDMESAVLGKAVQAFLVEENVRVATLN